MILETGEKRLLKKRVLYRDEIREQIEEAILSKRLKPGDRIVETRWARILGVSQSPVREAIRELEMIGLVENRPFQGSYVRELTIKDLKDLYRVRMSLEMLGITDAVAMITDEQLAEIHIVLQEMQEATVNNEFDLYIKKNTLFHQKIIEVSQNKTLLHLWNQSDIRVWTNIGTKMSHRSLKNLSVRHQAIYEALKSRDEQKAVQAVVIHLKELIEELEKPLTQETRE